MLESLWNLLVGILSSVWGLISSILVFVADILVWLHVEAPRLEGLLVGVLLAWLLTRREAHPLIRVLSAPLKLILDILDLAWDQAVEVAGDLWSTCKGAVLSSWGWLRGGISGMYSKAMNALRSKKEDLENEE